MPRGRRRRMSLAAGAAIVIALVAFVVLRGTPARADTVRRLAVLPLASARGSADSGLMADGVTRSVIEALTEAGVAVVGHRSVERYAGSTKPIRDIARELGVDAVVVGEVAQSKGE